MKRENRVLWFDFSVGKASFRLSCVREGVFRLRAKRGGKLEMSATERLFCDLGEQGREESAAEMRVGAVLGAMKFSCGNTSAVLRTEPFSLAFYQGRRRITALDLLTKNAFGAPLKPKEALFGTGERFNGVFQRGKAIDLYSVDHWCQTEGNSYAPIPLILSNAGYAFFINRFERMLLDLDSKKNGELFVSVAERGILDLYVFLSENPADFLYDYASIAGFSPVPPSFAYGIHVSRHGGSREFSSYEGVAEMVEQMEEHALPWDCAILEGFEPYDFAKRRELKKLSALLNEKGKKYLLYQSCGRYLPFRNPEDAPGDEAQRFQIRDEFAVSDPKTGEVLLPDINIENPADAPNARIYRWLDPTNPQARAQWFGDIWKSFATEYSCAGAKMDFCEQFPGNRPLSFRDGRSVSGTHHWYPVLVNTLTYRNFVAQNEGEAMLFARGGGIGAQNYPILWAGDQLREWRFLPAMLCGVLSAGLSGLPFMAFDLGGYLPSRDSAHNNDRDIFLRGAQMACFSVCMQTHGKVRRPYDFEEETIRLYRLYCEAHEALRPYLEEQGKRSCETGLPLCRHLFLSHPKDRKTYHTDDVYFLGDALLCAPVLSDATRRDIYLPAGEYIDLYDGTVYTGGKTLRAYPAPLGKMPVFLKRGETSPALEQVLPALQSILRKWETLS